MPRVRVRRATVRDLDVLVRHRRGMWEALGFDDPAMLDAASRVFRRWARQRMKTRRLISFVLEVDGRPVSSASIWLQPSQPRPHLPVAPTPYLMSMFTEPAHRKRGYATRIVRESIRWCRAHGYRRLVLHASRFGLPIYRKLGFEPTSEMRIRIPAKRKVRRKRR